MPHIGIRASKDCKDVKKKKSKQEHLQNIISLRINDDEKKTLEKLTKSTSKSISDIMREAIQQWSANRRKHCMD